MMVASVKIDEQTQTRLKRLAEARQRTPHYLMREAISQYLEREEARESFKQEAQASWEEYLETGLHLTYDEVAGWLDSWGTDEEASAPQCHE